MLTFNEVNLKTVQERKKYYAMNPAEPLRVTMTKDIVPSITTNLQIITLASTTFISTIEHNVDQMSKHIVYI